MPALFDVDLEQVAHVVKGRRGFAEETLLLDGRRFGIALDDDQPAQHRAVFARQVLPDRFALVLAEGDLAAFLLGRQQDAPAVFRHLDVAELGPAFGIHADGGAQVDLVIRRVDRPHAAPPLEVLRIPGFERTLQPRVG